VLGEHGEGARGDLGETAADVEALRSAVAVDGQDAGADRRDEGRVVGENAKLTLGTRHDHLGDFAGEQLLLRRDQFEREGRHGFSRSLSADHAASAASLRPFSTASSMVPTM
jgi:hypothetical protein